MKQRVISPTVLGWWLSSGMSWASTGEASGFCYSPMETMQHVLFGPLAYALVALVLVCSGLVWAFSDHHVYARRLFAGALGSALALVAPETMTALGWTGALF